MRPTSSWCNVNWVFDMGLLQFATAEFAKDEIIKVHSHGSMPEVFYVISGSLKLITDDKAYLINGDTLIVPPKQKHSLVFTSPQDPSEDSKLVYFNSGSPKIINLQSVNPNQG